MQVRTIILFITMMFLTESAFTQDNRSYNQVAKSPQTVVDYFLLCGEIRLSPEEGLITSAENICPDQSTMFYERKRLLSPGKIAGFTITPEIIDIRNGYIRIEIKDEGTTAILTFVIFTRADKSIIPAYSVVENHPDGDSRKCVFFDLREHVWKRYDLSDLFPAVKLPEFYSGRNPMRQKYADLVDWEYVLPRKGTTVYLVPCPIDDHTFFQRTRGTGRDLEDYCNFMKKSADRAVEMKWDASGCRFTRGGIVYRDK